MTKRYPGVFTRDDGKTFCFRAQYGAGNDRWGVHGSGYRTMKDAWDARVTATLDAERQRGRARRLDPSITLGKYLDHWLAEHSATLRPGSVSNYLTNVTALQRLEIAKVQVRRLNAGDVRRLIGVLREHHTYSTLQGRLRVLRVALNAAVRDGLLRTNPAVGIKVARTTPKFRAKTWDANTALRFLAHRAAAGDPLYAAWHLALTTGLRRGEVLGLRWDDVDLDAGILWVRIQRTAVRGRAIEGPAKTEGSDAPVQLDPETCRVLRAHRLATPISAYVFPDPATARPWQRCATFTGHFQRASIEAGVPVIRFHDLRHTTASLMAAGGVHIRDAQERMRHWSPAMTEAYTHAQAGAARETANRIGAILTGTA